MVARDYYILGNHINTFLMKKILFVVFVFLHFAIIIYNNVIVEEQTLISYFSGEKKAGSAYKFLNKIPFLGNSFSAYTAYTGTETGYGFYAPNVSSQTILLFTSKDSVGNIISVQTPKFHSAEALQRCFSAFDVFLDKLEIKNKNSERLLNAILKSMALWVLETNKGCRKVDADLLIYNLPKTSEIQNNKPANYIKLSHYEYTL
ncbi:MAG: hypothetical protein BGO69_04775 [Bacteroidetes bacterium 46-16]|nr:MAG: hypothetical protein BGO69_04775 [Bacteroidetes bacterium 46-16]